jgi:hypothetical protein
MHRFLPVFIDFRMAPLAIHGALVFTGRFRRMLAHLSAKPPEREKEKEQEYIECGSPVRP